MRFTKKLKPPYERVAGEDYVYTSETRLTPSFAKVEQKVGRLEDIEEKLGVDIPILIEALEKGIVILGEDNIVRPCLLRMFYEKPTLVVDYHDGTCGEVYVAGYKKTWVLEGEKTND